MREFNTSGPCDPDKHYTVMREALVAKGQTLVDRGHFFTVFAPNQSGKTTYVRLLSHQLRTHGYLPISVDFAGLNRLTKATFYKVLAERLFAEVSAYGRFARPKIKDAFDIVSNAQEKEAIMRRVLFGHYPVRYPLDDPNINYLSAHGVVANVNGFIQVPVPLYRQCLITAFQH